MNITLKGFKVWLESKNPDDKVGSPNDSWGCPLYQYLSTLGYEQFALGTNIIFFVDGNIEPETLPNWAISFLPKIREVTLNGQFDASVKQCLNVVEKLEKMEYV